MNLDEIYKYKSNFASRKVGEELVLVPLKNNIANMKEIYTFNEVGAFIWENIDGRNDEASIINLITDEFSIDESTARKDFKDFIECLKKIL